MLDVGLKATRKTIGFPLESPPFTPPAPFFRHRPDSDTIGSLCSDPFIAAARNPVSELYSAHAWNGKHGMGQQGFHRIEKRLPDACGDALRRTFDNASERIAFSYGIVKHFPPCLFSTADSADFDKPGIYAHILQNFLGTTPAATTGSVSRPEK